MRSNRNKNVVLHFVNLHEICCMWCLGSLVLDFGCFWISDLSAFLSDLLRIEWPQVHLVAEAHLLLASDDVLGLKATVTICHASAVPVTSMTGQAKLEPVAFITDPIKTCDWSSFVDDVCSHMQNLKLRWGRCHFLVPISEVVQLIRDASPLRPVYEQSFHCEFTAKVIGHALTKQRKSADNENYTSMHIRHVFGSSGCRNWIETKKLAGPIKTHIATKAAT